MATAQANGIEICYETFGSRDDPALLLIMGLGAQLIAWPDEFCAKLAERGFNVVRFDNRDIGLSTHFDDAGEPDLIAAASGNWTPAYTLDTMADDTAGLLDALAIDAAHVVGVSMGGMIAQQLTIRHPQKVLSLASIMSNIGGADAVPPDPEAMQALMAPRPNSRDEIIELALKISAVIGSTGFPRDEVAIAKAAGAAFDRSYHPQGMLRQTGAIMSAQSRLPALAGVKVPTVVIHGTADTLVPPENGRRTAAAIPGADLVMIDGMGHDLPEGAWPRVIEAILTNIAKAN